jgi:hypothetical protein
MLADIAHQRSQSLLRQRKALLAAVAFSFVVNVALGVAVTSKDREVILQPVAPRALQISASGVSADYLEFVTRDTALMLLNRTPGRPQSQHVIGAVTTSPVGNASSNGPCFECLRAIGLLINGENDCLASSGAKEPGWAGYGADAPYLPANAHRQFH